MERVCNKKLVIRDKKKISKKICIFKMYRNITAEERNIDCVRNEKAWLDDRLDY